VMCLKGIIGRISFWKNADRLGPDIPINHWKLYFPILMRSLCKKKFLSFSDSAELRPGAYVVGCSKISIGSSVVIRPQSMLFADNSENGKGIIIEDDVLLGSGVQIYTHDHAFDDPMISIIDQGYSNSREIVIKEGCWIGANSIILAGVTIGENAVVGAGSVVTKSIPARVVAAGNPARVIKVIEQKDDSVKNSVENIL